MTQNEINAMLRPPVRPITIDDSIVRDYFAAAALPSVIKTAHAAGDWSAEDIAQVTFTIANAMMEQRKIQ